MKQRPHVLVAGGGHNGLVAANYLARNGFRVTLVEARETLGGVVGPTEFMPGYKASVTNSPGSFEGRILEELDLRSYGLRFHAPDITLLQHAQNRLFVGWRDRDRVAEQMNAASSGEATRHRQMVDYLNDLGSASGLSLWDPPISLDEVLANMEPSKRRDFKRTFVDGTLSDLLDSSLESDLAKSLMMMVALNGNLISPDEPGSAIGLLLRPISRASSRVDTLGIGDSPLRGSVGLPIGSMSAIIDALEKSAIDHGVEVVTKDPVESLIVDDEGVVRSAALASGKTIGPLDHSVLTMEPSLIQNLLPNQLAPAPLYPDKPTGSAFKAVVALNGLPDVSGAPGDVPLNKLLEAQFRVGPDPEYIRRAVHDGISGMPSMNPIIWGLIHSLSSPEVAPDGKHLLSLNVWHAPYSLGAEYWKANKSHYLGHVLETLEEYFPGLNSRIDDVVSYTPHDLEAEFNLSGSNITHGDMTVRALLDGRPSTALVNTLSHHGITLGGAGSWPGGYVSGVPGRNAASKVIQTQKEKNNARISR
ncbi:NAD(P)/FAD-dependent oxidoreductase [Yaniella flava]|uniref:Pyridine nucleotide-disulfide oxidoreductase domain-containing protein 2 n=1 Tax=Yaniella flava TaxID=287930 RepID=A0ABN2UZK3_9MICC